MPSMERCPTLCAATALILVSAVSTARAGVNGWTVTGPDGGQVHSVVFHPTQPGVALAGAGRAIYRSTDSGLTWAPVAHLQNSPVRLVVDPSNPDRILAATTPIYRSDDGGASFQIAAPIAGGENVAAVAFSADGTVLYGLTLLGRVYRSTNVGQSWSLRSNGLPGTGDFGSDIVVSPSSVDIAYTILQGAGLFKTIDGGMNWNLLGFASQAPIRVAIDPSNPDQLLLAAGIGMYRSTNAGQTWALTASGNFRWVGFDSLVAGRAVAVPTIGPVLRSSDGGTTWLNGATNNAAFTFDGALDRGNPGALLVATGDGVTWSNDGGASVQDRSRGLRAAFTTALATTGSLPAAVYASFYPGPGGVHRRVPNGWEPTNNAALRAVLPWPLDIQAVAVDPTDSATLYAAGLGGVAKSTDSGASWFLPSSVFGSVWVNAVAVDPFNPQVLYATSDSLGVMRSGNGGATWVPQNTGLPSIATRSIIVDPADSNVSYVTTEFGARLFKTIDAGQNWSPVETGLPSPRHVLTLSIDPSDSAVVYVGLADGLYKSMNGGLNWAALDTGAGTLANAVLIDPVVPSNLVIVNRPGASGALRSVDAGQTWEEIPFSAPPGGWIVSRAVLDPLRPNVIVAAPQGLGVAEIEIAPDLALTLSGLAAELPIGSNRSATLTLQNLGPFAASDVLTDLTVPAWLTPGAASTPRGTCSPVANGVRCRIGALRSGEQIAVNVPLDVTAAGSGVVTASVAGHESDPAAANNASSINASALEIADLAVTIAPDRATIDNREAVRLTARASNSGPSPVSAALVSIPLAAGLTFNSANATRGACTAAAGTVTCNLGLLANGQDATIEINATAAAVGSLTTTASVSGAARELAAGNNSASATVMSRAVVDLGAAITDSPEPVQAGQRLTYSITVQNAGPDAAPSSGLAVAITGADIASATADQGTCTIAGTNVTCQLGDIAGGASRTVTVQTTSRSAGSASATATASVSGTDTVAANNSDSETTAVTAAPPPPSSGGGGGGAISGAVLAVLLVACAFTGRRRRRFHHQSVWMPSRAMI